MYMPLSSNEKTPSEKFVLLSLVKTWRGEPTDRRHLTLPKQKTIERKIPGTFVPGRRTPDGGDRSGGSRGLEACEAGQHQQHDG